MERRMQARASWTLRKYGYCRADEWERDDAHLAARLLERLERVASQRRSALRLEGDLNECLWPNGDLDLDGQLAAAARELAGDNVDVLCRANKVADRLLGEYHRPVFWKLWGV